MIDEEYFSEINTDKKAYFLGFFIADGFVSIDLKQRCYGRFGIDIQEKDGYLLEELAKELLGVKIYRRDSKRGNINRKPQCFLR